MLTLATWNVNSIKARLPVVLDWLRVFAPDVVLLQEIKCIDADFPVMEFKAAGYDVAVHGQKAYNGVAILSRVGLADVSVGLPGNPDDLQARYIEATVANRLRIAAIYLPNGNPVGMPPQAPDPKFTYKIDWMRRLNAHAQNMLQLNQPLVIGGDFNVFRDDRDCYAPDNWRDDALMRPESRNQFHALLHQGWTDAVRIRDARPGLYSFWDYQGGAWAKNHGLRIDYLLLSPEAADALIDAGTDPTPRSKEKASDHTPVWCRLAL